MGLRSALFVLALVLAPGFVRAQGARPREHPSLVIDGTVLEVQPGAPRCGTVVVAGWVRVRVDTVRTPIGGHIPSELVVMVQCPAAFSVGARWRFELFGRRPTTEHWGMFSVWPSTSLRRAMYWALRARPIRAP